jgi:hypothetical protein
MTRARTMTALVVAATLLFTACGDSTDKTATTASAGSTGSTATSGADGSSPSITGKPATDAGKSGDLFCANGSKLADQIDNTSAGAAATDTKKSFDALTALFAELTKTAPKDIKADFETMSAGYAAFGKTLAKYNYDYSKLAADPTALASLQALSDPKFEQASANIEAWVQKNCPELANK